MLDLSRYLLIKGATLVYGGHLGAESYMQKLFELVRTHNSLEDARPFERVVNHRAGPSHDSASKSWPSLITSRKRPTCPSGRYRPSLHPDFAREPKFFPADKSPEHRFAWARGMTELRTFQSDRPRSGIVARIVLGGTHGLTPEVSEDVTRKEQWHASRIRGVLENVLLSARARQPVFLIQSVGTIGSKQRRTTKTRAHLHLK